MWGLSLLAFFAVEDRDLRRRYKLLAVCVLLPIAVFFNLYYVHDYYLMAVSPFVCAFAGACFYELEKHLQGTSWLVRYLICISLVVSITLPGDYWNSYFKTKEKYMASDEWKIVTYVNEKTPEKDSILILGNDWSSHLQYYMKHPAATIPEWPGFKMPDMDFGWIVCGKDNSIWLEKYPNRQLEKQIGKWKVYKIVQ